jgi:hypothetical protein
LLPSKNIETDPKKCKVFFGSVRDHKKCKVVRYLPFKKKIRSYGIPTSYYYPMLNIRYKYYKLRKYILTAHRRDVLRKNVLFTRERIYCNKP